VGGEDVAAQIVPLIVEHRDDTERERRPAAPIVEALIDTRLSRVGLPEEHGGLGASLVETFEVYEVLAGAEASVSWLLWNSAQVCLFSRFLPAETSESLFADRSSLFAISAIPAGRAIADDHGYRVSGRWPLVSGCELADWILLNCSVADPEQLRAPGSDYVVVDRSQVEILDTWYTGGMRGTGSHDVVVEDLAVPRNCTLLWSEVPAPSPHPVDRLPIVASLTAGLAAQMLGIGAGALEVVTERARTAVTGGPMPDLRDRGRAQEAVASHGSALAAARTHLHDRAGHVWHQALVEAPVDVSDVADLYGSALHAMDVARDAVDAMYETAGTSAIYTSSPLERAHRDLHVMLRHRLAGVALREDVGRVRFGLEPSDPLFAI
jgi:indole-3-acetate monooxygenase